MRWLPGTLVLLAMLVLPAPAVAQLPAADTAWSQGRFGAAREAYLRALAEDPASVRANFRLGVLAAWDGNLDSAMTLLTRARTADPDDPDVRAMQATVLSWAGRYLEAIAQWDSLMVRFPARIDVLTGKARTLAWAGRGREADSIYHVALVRDPTNTEALNGSAQLAYWEGRTAEAIRGYERALSYRPGDVTARVGLARVYQAVGRSLDARAQADSALALSPGNGEALQAEREIVRAVQSAADVTSGWSNDSDHNTMWWQLVSVATPLANRVRGFSSFGAYEGTSRPNVTAARGTAEFGATYVQPHWQLTGALGGQGLWPDSGLTRSVPTARLGATGRIGSSIGIGAGYSHLPYAETASLIGTGLNVDAVDGAIDVTLAPRISLSGGGGAAWFSDGNRRASAVLAVMKQLPWHLSAGGVVRSVWFREKGTGYFSPERFAVLEGRIGYARSAGDWETRLSAGIGAQQIGAGAPWQFEGHVEGRGIWWFSAQNRVELFAGVSNSAYLSATGAYRFKTAGLTVRFGL